MTADATTRRYCPCNGICHDSDSPCSMDCFAHHDEVQEHPEWFGIGADNSTTRLREALADSILDAIPDHTAWQDALLAADAILASLVEHRDDVLDVLGAEQHALLSECLLRFRLALTSLWLAHTEGVEPAETDAILSAAIALLVENGVRDGSEPTPEEMARMVADASDLALALGANRRRETRRKAALSGRSEQP